MKQGFKRNAVFSILGRGWSIILGVMATPYIIDKVGINGFGAWVLAESIIAYFSLADMSVGASFSKYIAEYHIKKEYEKLSEVVSAGLIFYLVCCVGICLLALSLEDLILKKFDFSVVSLGDVSFVYLSLIVMMCLRMTSTPFWGVANGVLRYDVLYKAKISAQTLNFVGIFLFLHLGYGLKGLAVNAILYALIDIVLAVIIAFYLVPSLKISITGNSRDTFKRLFKYGLVIQFVALGEVVNEQIDKVFLGIFRTVLFVGMYEIGAKIANVANSLAAVILQILVPTTSQLHAAGEVDEIRRLYLRATRIMAMVVTPIATLVVFHAAQLVRLWMGKAGFEPAATAAGYLIVGFSFYLIAGVGRLMSRGIGLPKYEMQSGFIICIVNLVLSYFMVQQWGIKGAVIASLIALALGSLFFMVKFNRQMKVANMEILQTILLPVAISLIAIWPTTMLPLPAEVALLVGLSIRMQSFFYLAVVSVMSGLGYCCMLYACGVHKKL